jgi:hypothetical protein
MKKKKVDNISEYEKLQALKTIPEFIADLKDINNTKAGGAKFAKEKTFEERYGFCAWQVDFHSTYFEPGTVWLVPLKHRKRLSRTWQNGAETIVFGYDGEPYIKDGRYAMLKLDLMQPKREVMRAVGEKFNLLSDRVKRQRSTRPLSLEREMWNVYGMHVKEGMDFSAITRKLFPELKEARSAAHDPDMKKKRKAVVAAYKKARARIKQVQEDLKEKVKRQRSTPPLSLKHEMGPLGLEHEMWNVYDMHVKEGMDFSAITRKLFPELKKARSDDPDMKMKRKAVEAVYKKALARRTQKKT